MYTTTRFKPLKSQLQSSQKKTITPLRIKSSHLQRAPSHFACKSMSSQDQQHVLIADIGGTNCRFQLWSLDDSSLHPIALTTERFLPTADYPHFHQAMQAFLHSDPCKNIHPIAAAFACAGPVKNQRCEFTNLGWVVDADDVATSFNIHSTVLNDFEAVGYGITALPPSSIVTLHDAKSQAYGPIAVLGPGTGLGEAQLFYNHQTQSYTVQPSEGSHATFAPRGDVQRALQKHIEEELGHCEVEHVACGSGLVRIYDFLHQYRHRSNNNNNNNSKITPAEVSKAALLCKDPLASEALDIMLAIVGAEAGHMALRALSSGGVYICGGVFPKVLDKVISGGAVKDGFLWKESRFYEKVLKNVPLYVVTEENVGLIGAREQAAMLVKRDRGDRGVVMSG